MELINKSKAYDTIYNICSTADASNEYREGFECGKSLACVAIKKMECECAFVNLKKRYEHEISELKHEIDTWKGQFTGANDENMILQAQMNVVRLIFSK
jgi:hypothetical protein